MPIDAHNVWVFRIIPIENLETDLRNGLYAKNHAPLDPNRVNMANTEIINERNTRVVMCYPDTVVNDYVPFYFSVRTPMLLNIITGRGVPKREQRDIVYLCFKLMDLATPGHQWCFTDGNAAKSISRYYTNLNDLDNLDWRSITTNDFRANNADGDEDRIRKKHAEFLVKEHVPTTCVSGVAVLNPDVRRTVDTIIRNCNLTIETRVKTDFYFT